jgi:hypothetical protein
MAETLTITGLKETQKALYGYSQKLGDFVVYKSLRAGAAIIAKQARVNAPRGSTGKLKRGITVMRSRINNGRKSKLLGVTITIRKRKGDPFYGRFQEDGWNTRGKSNDWRQNYRAHFLMTRRSVGSSRVTQRGKTDVPGLKFIDQAFIDKREAAVNMIVGTATASAELLARKLGL